MIRVTHRVAIALLFSTAVATALASEPTSKEFVKDAIESNLAEIQISQLALTKTSNPEVMSFAQRMIDDHTRANSQLQQVAEQKGIKSPDSPGLSHQAKLKAMQARSGADFDKSYIDQMNQDHEKAIELFQAAANSPQVDPELKKLAEQTLPTLHQHQHSAMQLAAGEAAARRR